METVFSPMKTPIPGVKGVGHREGAQRWSVWTLITEQPSEAFNLISKYFTEPVTQLLATEVRVIWSGRVERTTRIAFYVNNTKG